MDDSNLNLLRTFQKSVTCFLDEEEKLGFLKQKEVDKIISIENMLDELIVEKTVRHDNQQKQEENVRLKYHLADNDGGFDAHLVHKRNQPEL